MRAEEDHVKIREERGVSNSHGELSDEGATERNDGTWRSAFKGRFARGEGVRTHPQYSFTNSGADNPTDITRYSQAGDTSSFHILDRDSAAPVPEDAPVVSG